MKTDKQLKDLFEGMLTELKRAPTLQKADNILSMMMSECQTDAQCLMASELVQDTLKSAFDKDMNKTHNYGAMLMLTQANNWQTWMRNVMLRNQNVVQQQLQAMMKKH